MALTGQHILLYAAGETDYASALGAAAIAGIPSGNVTGSFTRAWNATASGQSLVIAVGGAALNALYFNPCGWANPKGEPGGHTPFSLVATPQSRLLGANRFLNAAGISATDTLYIASAFAYYAVHGQLPYEFAQYPHPISPTEHCVGAADVPCPCRPSGSTLAPVTSPTPSPSPLPVNPSTRPHSLPYWGVDSAAAVTTSFFQCVVQHYGQPDFWGRYIKTVSGVSDGLTESEVSYLHQQGVKVLAIFNNFGTAVRYTQGATLAKTAIAAAQSIGLPTGKAIFADVEVNYPVDDTWIRGWVDTVAASGYVPGIYNNPINGAFPAAYQKAVSLDAAVAQKTILWSNEREPGITTKASAPAWNPAAPPTSGRVLVWQYGENGNACANGIDTNLADPSALQYLW